MKLRIFSLAAIAAITVISGFAQTPPAAASVAGLRSDVSIRRDGRGIP